ncbi:MAG: ComF family protein [Armatimonadetes bacterium]|nr:ComF family protein [Armatimonadota bacterium]
MKSIFTNFLNPIIDLIFPKICLGCNCKLGREQTFLCSECEAFLEFLTGNICEICGSIKVENQCRTCETNTFSFDKACSVFHFNQVVQNLIHELKYSEMTKIAKYLGGFTVEYLEKFQPFKNVDIISPVPLHKVKKRARGFNQAEFLTKEIAKKMNWQHTPNLVLRKKFTKTQTKLKRNQRQINVSGAFVLNPKFDVAQKNILIVDDVFTTGSTVNAFSKLLKNNAVSKIYVLTIARA